MTHVINPKLESRQLQIITGTILGGSSIIQPSNGKNCYLSMRSKDEKWLFWKASHLTTLSSNRPVTVEKTNRWHSLCYPVFNDFREKFYEGDERCLKLDEISLLQDVGIATWFGDCGKYARGEIILNTHIWKEQSETIVEYFSLIEIDSEIFKERNNYRVKISEKSSIDFFKLVLPHLPGFVQNRLSPPGHIHS